MATKTSGKIGGKRKIWFTKLKTQLFPNGQESGLMGDGKPNAAVEIKVTSNWKPGRPKSKNIKHK